MWWRSSASGKGPKPTGKNMKPKKPDIRREESTIYDVLQRLSVAIGLIAIAPLTHIWQRPGWLRVLFVVIAVALIAATTYDLLPRWSRRWPVAGGSVLALVIIAAWAPGTHADKRPPLPETDGSATIASPPSGQLQALTVREAGGYTDGFVASGTCVTPPGYRAVLVSRADRGPGYWLLSDGIISDCVDDDIAHQWTAKNVDPSWSGMEDNKPITIGVIVLRKDLAEWAQLQKVNNEPLNLPQPAASTSILVTRAAAGTPRR